MLIGSKFVYFYALGDFKEKGELDAGLVAEDMGCDVTIFVFTCLDEADLTGCVFVACILLFLTMYFTG